MLPSTDGVFRGRRSPNNGHREKSCLSTCNLQSSLPNHSTLEVTLWPLDVSLPKDTSVLRLFLRA